MPCKHIDEVVFHCLMLPCGELVSKTTSHRKWVKYLDPHLNECSRCYSYFINRILDELKRQKDLGYTIIKVNYSEIFD